MECTKKAFENSNSEDQNKDSQPYATLDDTQELKGEQGYLSLLKRVLKNGIPKNNRTGTDTLSLFGQMITYDLSDNKIPIFTTKKVLWEKAIIELLWFLKGNASIDWLQENNLHFWDANASRSFLDKRNLTSYREGELGPVYPFQWRHFGAKYEGCDKSYDDKGVDQIKKIVKLLKKTPFSRRIILTAWNPCQLKEMALPPCHCMAQFNVTVQNNTKVLDCMLFQRSGDLFLGVPFNVVSYSLLTRMLCEVTGYKPGKFVHAIGDAHIYINHVDAVKTQLQRDVKPQPTLSFKRSITDIDNFKIDDFTVQNYSPHAYIYAPMAV